MRAALVLLAGCWSGSTTEPIANQGLPSAFEITLERTECLIPCPEYKVTIDGDGKIHWTGIKHVDVIGERYATVPPRRVREIQQLVEDVQFFARNEWGELPNPDPNRDIVVCADGSSAKVTVRTQNREKVITNLHCGDAAKPVEQLEALVDDIARTSAWIGKRVLTHE